MQRLRRTLAWVVGLLLAFALLLRVTAFEVWTMPDDAFLGASTSPTLATGDVLVLLRRGTPGFGDLVRCPDPQDATRYVIGRIAGVEGDVVEIEGRKLTVNERTYESEAACTNPKLLVKNPETLRDNELRCDVVPMGGGWHYRASAMGAFQEQKKTATVKAGMVFLVSDNRAMHDDSRDFGLVQRDTCTHRPVVRLWSAAGWGDDAARMTLIH